jgi:hypothetical protein
MPRKEIPASMSMRRNVRWSAAFCAAGGLIWLSLCVLSCGFPIPALAQSQEPPTVQREVTDTFDARETGASAGEPDRQLSGYISGTVLDKSGAVALGAQVRLTRDDQSPTLEVLSGDNGQFSFANLPPGPFLLTIAGEGFETQRAYGTLLPGRLTLCRQLGCLLPPLFPARDAARRT